MDYVILGASCAEYRSVLQARQAIAETGAWLADHLPEDPKEVQAKNLAQLQGLIAFRFATCNTTMSRSLIASSRSRAWSFGVG